MCLAGYILVQAERVFFGFEHKKSILRAKCVYWLELWEEGLILLLPSLPPSLNLNGGVRGGCALQLLRKLC